MKIATVAFLLPLLLGSPAHAEMSAKQYTQKSGTQHMLDTVWLYGVQNGFALANATNVNHGFPPLYCQPEHLALTRDQVIDLLDNYIKEGLQKLPLDTEVSVVLLMALKRAFPCPQ